MDQPATQRHAMSAETEGTVRLYHEGVIARMVLDRPAKRNALSTHMLTELSRCLDEVAANAEVRVLTLQARGPVFCAGADTAEFATTPAETIRGAWTRLGQRVFADLATVPQTTIAVLTGSAYGGGLELAMHCDFRVASPGVEIGLPEATLGTAPGWSGLARIVETAGLAAARALVLTARRCPAQDALRHGLIDVVAADVDSATTDLIDDILRTTPIAQAILKRALSSGAPTTASALIDSLAGAYLEAAGETTPTGRTT